jgi:hypothetical protein
VLPTAANLNRWKITSDPNCLLCKTNLPQTNKHVLANCPSPIALNRYTERHDEILQILYLWIQSVISPDQQVLVDLKNENNMSTNILFNNLRPDLAILDEHTVNILELTICHESNLRKSKAYKLNKYRSLANDATPMIRRKVITCFSLEISTSGFISSLDEFTKSCKIPQLPDSLKCNIIRSTLNSSFKIYCNRNNV